MRKVLRRRESISPELETRLRRYLAAPVEPSARFPFRVDAFQGTAAEVGGRLRDHHPPQTERLLRDGWKRLGNRILREFEGRADNARPWGALAFGEPKGARR